MGTVDLRCPNGLGTLLMRLKLDGERPTYVEGNLMELACPDCRTRLRKKGTTTDSGERVRLVLHRYNFLGELVETDIT